MSTILVDLRKKTKLKKRIPVACKGERVFLANTSSYSNTGLFRARSRVAASGTTVAKNCQTPPWENTTFHRFGKHSFSNRKIFSLNKN